MAFTDDKRAFLTARFGADRVKELEDAEGAQAKALDAAGVTFKETTQDMPAEDEAPPAPPAPVAEAKQEPGGAGGAMDMPTMLAEIGSALATLQAQVAALTEALAPAQAEMEASKAARETHGAQLAALQKQITALKQSDDEKIARVMNPRIAPAATSATAQGVAVGASKEAQAALDSIQALANNQFDWLKTVNPF